jgi:hypothetical protein
MRWGGDLAHMEETRNAYRIFPERYEWKRPLGRPKHWSHDSTEIHFKETSVINSRRGAPQRWGRCWGTHFSLQLISGTLSPAFTGPKRASDTGIHLLKISRTAEIVTLHSPHPTHLHCGVLRQRSNSMFSRTVFCREQEGPVRTTTSIILQYQ